MNYLLSFLILSVFSSGMSASGCTLYYDTQAPGLFIQQVGSENVIVPLSEPGSIEINDGSSIQGLCSTGFWDFQNFFNIVPLTNVTLFCSSGVLYFGNSLSNLLQMQWNFLSCRDEVGFYFNNLSYCQNTGIAYGLQVANSSIVLADICYNTNKMSANFVHVVAGVRTTSLDQQSNVNPSNKSYNLAPSVSVFFDETNVKWQKESIERAIDHKIHDLKDIVKYEVADLVPVVSFAGPLSSLIRNLEGINSVPWWVPLKNGNWKGVNLAIENLIGNNTYDIYAGASSNVIYPKGGSCSISETLTYKSGMTERTIPLYLWNFIKQRNNSDEGVVIIGVNSPFFTGSSDSAIFCDDVCDNFDWLKTIQNTRKESALGYVFCCHPRDAAKGLEGFPQMNFN